MTKGEQLEFLKLVKQGTLEALSSTEGQKAIINALKTKEAGKALIEFFMDAFNEVILPGINNLQEDVDQLKSDVSDIAVDVNYLKLTAAKRDKYVQDLRDRVLRKMS